MKHTLKLNGKWFYKAVDKEGNIIDFFLRSRRNTIAIKAFFRNGRSDKVNIGKSGSNKATLDSFNKDVAKENEIEIWRIKYLNNIVEQEHRFIKKRTRLPCDRTHFSSLIG